MAEFSGGGIPPDISEIDIGANEDCMSSSSDNTLVSDSEIRSLGFSVKGEKRPRSKERKPKGKRSKVAFTNDSSLSIPLGQQDPASQDSSTQQGQGQTFTEIENINNALSDRFENMESLKKLRSILRRFYSNAERDLANAQRDGSDSNIHAMFTIAKQKAEELFSVDEKIKDMWFADIDASEDVIFADLQTADSYKSRWVIVSTNYYRQFQSNVDVASDVASMASHMNTACSDKLAQKRFTLPKNRATQV
ncbi:hypothetical protein ACJJTC_010138 [Scirpophaga incertulas]